MTERGTEAPVDTLQRVPGALWRVHDKARHPLEARLRSATPEPDWGRYDLTGARTSYAASSRSGAYSEVTAYAIPGTTPPWHTTKYLSTLAVRGDHLVLDVATSRTLAYLREYAHAWLPADHPLRDAPHTLDLSHLTGADRHLTVALATWAATRTDPADGQPISGIHYVSKHGADLSAYALWTDRPPCATKHLYWTAAEPVDPADPDFRAAARSNGHDPDDL